MLTYNLIRFVGKGDAYLFQFGIQQLFTITNHAIFIFNIVISIINHKTPATWTTMNLLFSQYFAYVEIQIAFIYTTVYKHRFVITLNLRRENKILFNWALFTLPSYCCYCSKGMTKFGENEPCAKSVYF